MVLAAECVQLHVMIKCFIMSSVLKVGFVANESAFECCFETVQEIRWSNNLLFTLASYNLNKCFLLWQYLGVPLCPTSCWIHFLLIYIYSVLSKFYKTKSRWWAFRYFWLNTGYQLCASSSVSTLNIIISIAHIQRTHYPASNFIKVNVFSNEFYALKS